MKSYQVLKNRDFIFLFLSATTSKFGTSFFQVALPLLVYKLTKSPSLMAVTFVLEITPQVLFSLIGGAFADKISKKMILLIGDIISAALVIVIPLSALTYHLDIWLVYIIAFLLSSISSFYHPSFESIVPEILKGENLIQGNSLLKLSETITTFIGPSIAGVLISMIGSINILYFNFATYFFSALFISFIAHKYKNINNANQSMINSIKEGIDYVVKTKLIFIGTVFIFLINLGYGAMESLFMFYLKGPLHLSSQYIGLIFSLQTLGSFFSIYLANKLNKFPRGNIMILAGILIGLGQTGLILSQGLLVILIVCRIIIIGSVTLLSINWFTLRQEIVPSHLLGRVISSTRMLSYLALPFGGMLSGIFVEHISVNIIFILAGAITIIISFIAIKTSLFNKKQQIQNGISSKAESYKP
ncbi:MFS family permease [Scopulibacillus daqui]|uniref:MFS family permease n=1 Tax=Scopulibacillus daqui TaxID=1469162 RepID=A0ABS2PXI5_9BACL|nr:MFS transporter [Scopulibacillus daqui]MBM7644586.1 MFS family permease [Scopulibacillus daqui]